MYKTIIINDQETNYLIFDDGRLFNKKTNHYLKGSVNSTGYRTYQLTIKGKYYNKLAHRLVAEYFLSNDNNFSCVHHKDGNRLNNHKNNLEWVDFSTNLKEAYIAGRKTSNTTKQYITEKELNSKQWRQIENTQYYISENGEIYNSNTRIKLRPKKDGYLRYSIYINNELKTIPAHILVYKAFVNNIIFNEIDHIDGNKLNNHYTNLRDISHSENMNNAMNNGHRNMIPVEQIDIEGNIIKIFPSIAAAAKEMKCQPALIRRAIRNGNKTHNYYWKKHIK